ncbi:stage II sporulation protein M [Fibrella forsythiae]|uniref:Stage II sporulation protein M n=1 Tax=Fibrella forsythiae TaxID=2817061 RepID=A0ABS3JFY3_9BACT|nr:stage II sporulation protein M [Fibrella forsythiae]MBO0948903.1 stage II sporulation protein M [Fibrella forsythiae]
MREAAFVKRNTEKWTDMERNPTRDPDELTARYVELTDDLSYARTFYPESNVTRYLNGLAAQMHRGLMQNKREERGRFVAFWMYELPSLFYHSQKTLAVSAGFFFIACFIGWLSAVNDPTFVRLILGDGYVNMTLENIKKGNPLGVYGGSDQASMFFQITLNNIGVSLRAFVAGVFASVGTLVMLFYNGVMLGAFQAFFYERGLLTQSLLKIWIHGTLEISAIVIAGAAGLTMGNSLLFPGTLPRMESFKRGAKQGLKIAVGLVPIFVMAGFLESFVTRMTLPPVVSLLIIGTSAAFIIWYFILYPIHLHRSQHIA